MLLQDLIRWLMGAPAGLKLNNQLSTFMGRFFLYHIYLWGIYVKLVAPLLAPLLKCVAVCGVLGCSLVLALLSDLLSAFLFHTYCFYIYAGRIYNVQIYMLAALVRLFAGTKWNVLRRRVDTLSSTSGQYLLGTLLFTVVLWLLPSTAVFYVVFAGMRLVVLTVYCLLSYSVLLIDHFPLAQILLRVCSLSPLAELDFKFLPPNEYDPARYATLKLEVRRESDGIISKHFSLHDPASHDDGKKRSQVPRQEPNDSDLAYGHLLACGRPVPLLDVFQGCPYGQCRFSGLLPRLDVLSIAQYIFRGYILYGPTHRLCKPCNTGD